MAVQLSISISDELLSDIDTLKHGPIGPGRSSIISVLLIEALDERRRKSNRQTKKAKEDKK